MMIQNVIQITAHAVARVHSACHPAAMLLFDFAAAFPSGGESIHMDSYDNAWDNNFYDLCDQGVIFF